MTDRDKIELPPEWLTIPAIQAWADARARDAVIAAIDLHDKRTAELRDELYDLKTELARCRKERDAARAEPAKPAEPKVHQAILQLTTRGNAVMNPAINSIYACAAITLCWTDDGRAWIESEKNANIAVSLRSIAMLGNTLQINSALRAAADALDGGAR